MGRTNERSWGSRDLPGVFRRSSIDRALRNSGLCALRPEGLEAVSTESVAKPPPGECDVAVADALAVIEGVLKRLDKRRHVTPSRLEVSHDGRKRWVAMIMSDAVKRPLSATGVTSADAITSLGEYLATATKRSI
jgi:hypothetical protein